MCHSCRNSNPRPQLLYQHLCGAYISVIKVKVKQYRYWPGVGFQEVKVPRFHDNGTGWW